MNDNDELVEELEDMLRQKGLLAVPGTEPSDPPRRVVVLETEEPHRGHAVFDGEKLTVYQEGASGSLELPYFNPDGATDEALVEKLKTLLMIS